MTRTCAQNGLLAVIFSDEPLFDLGDRSGT
jgi:hypothetical protein